MEFETKDDSDAMSEDDFVLAKMNQDLSPLRYKHDPKLKMIKTDDRSKESSSQDCSTEDNSDSGSKTNDPSKIKFGFNWALCDHTDILDDEVDYWEIRRSLSYLILVSNAPNNI